MQSNFVQTSDLRMHYLQAGSGDPVVLIHGFPETSFEWRQQFPALAERYAVFAPDTRGFGRTDKPDIRVSRQLLAGDIVRFMDALGIERAAVVGHDWGGIIAFKLAIDWPERVSRLALLDTLCTVWAPRAVHGYWFKAKPLPEEFFAKYHREFITSVLAGAGEGLPSRPASPWQIATGGAPRAWMPAEALEHYTAAFADPASHRHAISYYRYALPFHRVFADEGATHGERFEALDEEQVAAMWLHPQGLEQHPLHADYMDYGPEDRHKRYPGPALWMFGQATAAADGTAVPRGNPFVEQFSRYFPDLRVQRVAAGHFFPEEAPAVTNDALLRFLAAGAP
jgi:pimeloyl-ACP methyl ester carboxylesterase